MASDLAIVLGLRTGLTSLRPALTALVIGLQPVACAPNILVAPGPIKPSRSNSLNAL